MTKQEIMRLANKLMDELNECGDPEFIDEVTSRINYNDYFTEDEIVQQEFIK